MEKDTSQLQLYQHFLSFFLPEGILDFFEPVWMETQSLDSRESNKDILYSSSLHIYLDERDNRPEDMLSLRPNGLTEETVITDFPVRDRKVVLHVRRRRWLTPEGKNVVLNVYPLAATGTCPLRPPRPLRPRPVTRGNFCCFTRSKPMFQNA